MHPVPEFLILGCGYTARRVARRLVSAGARVVCTNRTHGEIAGAECLALDASVPDSLANLSRHLSPGMTVLHSIPAAGTKESASEATPQLLDALRPFAPARFIYVSTTGVYGSAQMVNERTPVAPEAPRDRLRVEAENLIGAGPWSSLVLRPAAIYGPGRGVHHSVQQGTFKPLENGPVISRIHVDDLAEHVYAGLFSPIGGAFPVADEEPCESLQVARLTAELLGGPVPPVKANASEFGRRVDGSAVRRALGIRLRYPSYREGVPASLKEDL